VYAISTLGSVAGTLLLGFFLLPIAGTRFIILILSIILTLLSWTLSVYENRKLHTGNSILTWAIVYIVCLGLLVSLYFYRGNKQYENYTVLSETETYYGWVRVVDQKENGIRWLMSDSSTIGAEDLYTGKSLLGYQKVVGLVPLLNKHGKTALLIGLGSGHLVNRFNDYGIVTDAIEIDPAVIEAANNHFSFKPTGRVIAGDARYQIRKLDRKYDFIIHDCFTGGAEPVHMLSLDTILELKSKLNSDGILALNFVGFTVEKDRKPVQSVAHTLDAAFKHRLTFVSAPGAFFNDFVFVVSDQPIEFSNDIADVQQTRWLEQHMISVTGNNGELITDDFNPLENLQIAKAEYYRNLLIERVGKKILFR
jgi:spermidine synthase